MKGILIMAQTLKDSKKSKSKFRCRDCGYKTTSATDLYDHVEKTHGDLIPDDVTVASPPAKVPCPVA